MIKMSRNHAMQIWGKINENQDVNLSLPVGWAKMGLQFKEVRPRLDYGPTFDRTIFFDVIDKDKFAWLIMQYDVEYET